MSEDQHAGPEAFREQLSRVELMASGSDTWDLSDNDIAALRAVLGRYDKAIKAISTYDYYTRYLISWLQAFIGHHRYPDFRKLPDLDEAEVFWKRANDSNVRICKELEIDKQ